jgi:hypothetical protein
MRAWEAYAAIHGRAQSAERIAERGGFGYRELQALLAGRGRRWPADDEPLPEIEDWRRG